MDNNPTILTPPEYFKYLQSNPELFISTKPQEQWIVRDMKDATNRYFSLQNLYLAYGWPNNFRGDEFETAFQLWNEKVRSLGNMAGPEFGNPQYADMFPVSDRMSNFLREGAKGKAV